MLVLYPKLSIPKKPALAKRKPKEFIRLVQLDGDGDLDFGTIVGTDDKLHAIDAVAGDAADEEVEARMIKRDHGGTIRERLTQKAAHGATMVVLDAAHLHHIVHLWVIVELCTH